MNPDHEIEQFWYSFKKSMENFYYSLNNNIGLDRPIKIWSNNLNCLQKEKKYEEIENYIIEYISLYAIDIMRKGDNYNGRILFTNIKRWNKLSKKYKIGINENNGINVNYYNIVFLLFDIYIIMTKNGLENLNIIFIKVIFYTF